MTVRGAGRYLTRLVCTAASGFGITFGDSGAFTTNGQEIRNLSLTGNANCAGAVKFFGTRECAVRKCYIHGFTHAAASAVLIDSADHNYFNEIEGCWFKNNEAHLKLAGSGGVGANSNYIFHNRFEDPFRLLRGHCRRRGDEPDHRERVRVRHGCRGPVREHGRDDLQPAHRQPVRRADEGVGDRRRRGDGHGPTVQLGHGGDHGVHGCGGADLPAGTG